MTRRKRITNPSELREQYTNYGILKFWETFTSRDVEFSDDDGGSALNSGARKDLKGLCFVCAHYNINRQNSLEAVRLRDLVDYVAENDQVFAERMQSFGEVPDLLARTWVRRVVQEEDKKLREMIGLYD